MLKLTKDRILVQGIPDPDKTEGGLWIPDVAKDRTDQGIVMYMGPDVKDLRIGDYVLFSGYDGEVIRLEDEGYFILLSESACRCVIQNADTEVNGLYFKSKRDISKIEEDIDRVLRDIEFQRVTLKAAKQILLNLLGIHDPYFPATYEMAMQIIARSFSENRDTIDHKNFHFDRATI